MGAAGSGGHPVPTPHAQPCRARSKCFSPELFLFPLVVLWGQGCNCSFSGALGPDTPGPQRPMSPAGTGAGGVGWTLRGWGKRVWVRYRRRRSGSGVPEARGTRPPPAGGSLTVHGRSRSGSPRKNGRTVSRVRLGRPYQLCRAGTSGVAAHFRRATALARARRWPGGRGVAVVTRAAWPRTLCESVGLGARGGAEGRAAPAGAVGSPMGLSKSKHKSRKGKGALAAVASAPWPRFARGWGVPHGRLSPPW